MAERTEADRLKELWRDSAERVRRPAAEGTAQALALGVNFRVDLVKAFKAAVETVQAVIKGTAAFHAPDPMTWAEAFIEGYTAIQSIFAALVQQLTPLEYVTAAILASRHPNSLTPDALREAVELFLREPKLGQFGWYMGVTESLVSRAREAKTKAAWMTNVVRKLKEAGLLEERAGELVFRSCHFKLGWNRE